MNIRFDSESVRIRVGHDEAVRLMHSQGISETFPVGGLTLELKTSPNLSRSLSFSSPLNYEVLISETALRELLEKVNHPHLKKDDLCIRDSIHMSESKIDLVFEIDCFKLPKSN